MYTIATTEITYYIDNNYVTSCDEASVTQYYGKLLQTNICAAITIFNSCPNTTHYRIHPLYTTVEMLLFLYNQKVLVGVVLILPNSAVRDVFLTLEVIRIVKSDNQTVTCILHEQNIMIKCFTSTTSGYSYHKCSWDLQYIFIFQNYNICVFTVTIFVAHVTTLPWFVPLSLYFSFKS